MSREEESGSEDEAVLTPGERVAALYMNEHMADVHFTFTDQQGTVTRLPAHKFVLATASHTFYTQFFGSVQDQNEIRVGDECITADTFKLLLKYLYCGTVQLDREQAPKLLYLAKKYLLKSLKSQCKTFLTAELQCYSDWCLDLLQYLYAALGESELTLIEMVLQLIEKHGRAAVTSDEFLCMSAELVSLIVHSDALDVDELTLFRMVVKWSKQECERRQLSVTLDNQRAVLQGILPHIRFTAVSCDDFCTMMKECQVLPDDVILDIVLARFRTTQLFNPQPRGIINDKASHIYIIGGVVNGSCSASVRMYSLDTGCKLTLMRMKEPRLWHCAAYCRVSKQIVVIGGDWGADRVSAEKCLLSDDRPVFTTMTMKHKRPAASSICIENKVYILGGLDTGSCECYDVLLDTWTDIAPLPHPVGFACCVLLEDDGKTTVLLIGGWNESTGVLKNTVQQYRPDENQWTDRIDLQLPNNLYCSSAITWKGNVVVIGGATGPGFSQVLNECYSLDMVAKQWVSLPNLKTKRRWHAAVVVGGKVVVMGGIGEGNKRLKSVEVYDGEQWTDSHDLDAPMFGFAAVVV